jgi:hypothetical protein
MVGSLRKVDPECAGQALNPGWGDAHATAALRALDPPELEQPAGDGRGQCAVQVPAALGPVDAGPGEVTARTAELEEIQAERAEFLRSGPGDFETKGRRITTVRSA